MTAINSNQVCKTPLHSHFIDDVVPIICSYLDDDEIGSMITDKQDPVWNKINQARTEDYPFLKVCFKIAEMTGEANITTTKITALRLLNGEIPGFLDVLRNPPSFFNKYSCKELQEAADTTDRSARLKFARFFARDSETKKKIFSAQSTDAELETWLKEKLSDPKAMDANELLSASNPELPAYDPPFSVILSPNIHPTHLLNLFSRTIYSSYYLELFRLNPVWKRIEQDKEFYKTVIWSAAEKVMKGRTLSFQLRDIQKLIDMSRSSSMPADLMTYLYTQQALLKKEMEEDRYRDPFRTEQVYP